MLLLKVMPLVSLMSLNVNVYQLLFLLRKFCKQVRKNILKYFEMILEGFNP